MFGWFGNSYERQRQRILETLRDYPVYLPPYRGRHAHKKARENFNYFLQTKNDRKSYIENYLRKMNGSVETTPAGINRIGRWLRDYGGYFMALSFSEQLDARSVYDPEWTGDLAGLNVINDLAIMVGEMIIARKPTARWGVFGLDEAEISSFEHADDEENSKDEGEQVPYNLVNPDIFVEQDDEGIEGTQHYLQPCLYGVGPSLFPEYVIGAMTQACNHSKFYLRGLMKTSGQWIQKTALLDYIEYFGRPDFLR
jgi:hypothetical protein